MTKLVVKIGASFGETAGRARASRRGARVSYAGTRKPSTILGGDDAAGSLV